MAGYINRTVFAEALLDDGILHQICRHGHEAKWQEEWAGSGETRGRLLTRRIKVGEAAQLAQSWGVNYGGKIRLGQAGGRRFDQIVKSFWSVA